MEDYFGIFPCKFNVLSTIETVPMKIGSRFYPNYPKIDTTLKPEQVATLFIDTLIMSNLYLNGLGADKSLSAILVIIYKQICERLTNGVNLIRFANGRSLKKLRKRF